MSDDFLKIKEFKSRWIDIRFVYKVESPMQLEFLNKRKELRFWYYPSKCLNFATYHIGKTYDSCYDFGVAMNNISSWVSIKLKRGK